MIYKGIYLVDLFHFVHYMLSQVMNLSAYSNPMPSRNKWSPSAKTYKCYNSSCGDSLIYLMACIYMSWSLLIGWSWANQGISLADLIHLGAYELIELDIYTFVACYEMIEWINWLVIKFGLIWVG